MTSDPISREHDRVSTSTIVIYAAQHRLDVIELGWRYEAALKARNAVVGEGGKEPEARFDVMAVVLEVHLEDEAAEIGRTRAAALSREAY